MEECVEVVAFSLLGWFYVDRFSSALDERARSRLALVGRMIAKDELAVHAIARTSLLSEVVGAPYLGGLAATPPLMADYRRAFERFAGSLDAVVLDDGCLGPRLDVIRGDGPAPARWHGGFSMGSPRSGWREGMASPWQPGRIALYRCMNFRNRCRTRRIYWQEPARQQ